MYWKYTSAIQTNTEEAWVWEPDYSHASIWYRDQAQIFLFLLVYQVPEALERDENVWTGILKKVTQR